VASAKIADVGCFYAPERSRRPIAKNRIADTVIGIGSLQ
jgi:hypothetical protein